MATYLTPMLEEPTSLSEMEIDAGPVSGDRGVEKELRKKRLLAKTTGIILGAGMASVTMMDIQETQASIEPTYISYSAYAPKIRDEREIVYDAIQKLFLSQNRSRDRSMAERLTNLYRDAIAEAENMNGASTMQFADFMLANSRLALPMITLSSTGNLRARWVRTSDDYFAIEFFGKPQAKVIMSGPQQGAPLLLAGLSNIEAIISTVRANGITAG